MGYERELTIAVEAARAAGVTIRDFYERGAATYTKSDGSVVTDADLAADRVIQSILRTAFPADPVLTEESVDDPCRLESRRCWIVDPIDGTNQFVERTGEFEVLIALVVDGRPVVAAIYQPTTSLMIAASVNDGAWTEQDGIRSRLHFAVPTPDAAPRLMTSVWLGAPHNLLALNRAADRIGASPVQVSSLGVTVRRFLPPDAATDALIGLRAPTEHVMAWEWDFVAPDLVVTEAGGAVSDLWGDPLQYNKPLPRNIGGIVMAVSPGFHGRIVQALAPELPSGGPVGVA